MMYCAFRRQAAPPAGCASERGLATHGGISPMHDFDQSTPPPTPIDWTDDGCFRAAFLDHFEEPDRDALRRAGVVLARQVVSGDAPDRSVVYGPLQAIAADLRMTSRHLQQVYEMPDDSSIPRPERDLCHEARCWRSDAADLAYEIEARVREAEGAPEPQAADTAPTAILRDLSSLVRRLESLGDGDDLAGRWAAQLRDIETHMQDVVEGKQVV